MTEQEAIQVFQELLDVPKEMLVRHEYALYEEQKEKINKVYLAEQMAIKALEKQIPKTVVFDGNEWTCPHCNTPVLDVNIRWCDICGQKLDWSDEE